MISSRMSETQKPLRDTDVQLVSFSVDPEHDTPAVLRDYASRLNAQAGRWHFLTGDKGVIYRLSTDGFKLAAAENGATGPIHSTRLVLVDRDGVIRGYYDATDADAVTRLLADTNHLLREQRARPGRPTALRLARSGAGKRRLLFRNQAEIISILAFWPHDRSAGSSARDQ